MFVFVEVPEHGDAVFAARRTQGSVWRDGNGGDVAAVSEMIGLQLALCHVPNLWLDVVWKGVEQRLGLVEIQLSFGDLPVPFIDKSIKARGH